MLHFPTRHLFKCPFILIQNGGPFRVFHCWPGSEIADRHLDEVLQAHARGGEIYAGNASHMEMAGGAALARKSKNPPCREERDKGGAPARTGFELGMGRVARPFANKVKRPTLSRRARQGWGTRVGDFKVLERRRFRVVLLFGVPHPCRVFCDRVGSLTSANYPGLDSHLLPLTSGPL
jgi:hypothetical protein